MAFSSVKLVPGPFPARFGGSDLPIKRPAIISTRKSLPLQVKSEVEWKPEAPLNLGVSRREMMIYLAAGTLIGQTEPVEARITKPEIRRKIREKLEMLREKAGLSKPKNENGMNALPAEPSVKKLSPSQHPYHSQILNHLWWKQIFPDHMTVMTLHHMIFCQILNYGLVQKFRFVVYLIFKL